MTKADPDPIKVQSEALHNLARSKRSPNGMQAVKLGLNSKWEGVQGAALRVLEVWGGRDAVEIAKPIFEASVTKGNVGGLGLIARDVLIKHMDLRDSPWVMSLAERRESWNWEYATRPLRKRLDELSKR